MQWITQHAQTISATANMVMVVVWTLYLQLIYQSYRASKRPKLLIQQTRRGSGKSLFSASNLSERPLNIEAIIIVLEYENGYRREGLISEYATEGVDTHNFSLTTAKQGPLQSGCHFCIGSFDTLVRRAEEAEEGTGLCRQQGDPEKRGKLIAFEVRVISFYGSDARPLAASRRFAWQKHPFDDFKAESASTRQWHAHRDRDVALEWLRSCQT